MKKLFVLSTLLLLTAFCTVAMARDRMIPGSSWKDGYSTRPVSIVANKPVAENVEIITEEPGNAEETDAGEAVKEEGETVTPATEVSFGHNENCCTEPEPACEPACTPVCEPACCQPCYRPCCMTRHAWRKAMRRARWCGTCCDNGGYGYGYGSGYGYGYGVRGTTQCCGW